LRRSSQEKLSALRGFCTHVGKELVEACAFFVKTTFKTLDLLLVALVNRLRRGDHDTRSHRHRLWIEQRGVHINGNRAGHRRQLSGRFLAVGSEAGLVER
jgi:hypothetical protein